MKSIDRYDIAAALGAVAFLGGIAVVHWPSALIVGGAGLLSATIVRAAISKRV